MPIFYQQIINHHTKLAIWKIEENESFFTNVVPIQSNITHPHKRLQHLAGRFLLKYLFPNFPYSEIKIADTRKPFLPNDLFHFSISHCNNFAGAIVSTKQRVGIDVEQIDKRVLKIVPKFLSDNERNIFDLKVFDNQEKLKTQLQYATLLWSIKESLFKWYSLGNVDFKTMLSIDYNEVEEQGILSSAVITPTQIFNLQTHYAFFGNLCLSYVID